MFVIAGGRSKTPPRSIKRGTMSDSLISNSAPSTSLPLVDRYVALSPVDRKIAAYKIAHPTESYSEMAKVLGLSRIYIAKRANSEGVRAMLQAVNELVLSEAKDLLIATSVEAVETLRRLMRGVDHLGDLDLTITPQVQLQAATRIIEFLKDYKGPRDEESEETLYEMIVDSVGNIRQKQKRLEASDPAVHYLDNLIEEGDKV